MKLIRLATVSNCIDERITQNDFNSYKELLLEELIKLGATKNELALISNAIIQNAILNHRNPEDVAWAILQ